MSIDNEEKLIDQQEALNTPLDLTKSAGAHQLETAVNQGLLAVQTEAELKYAKDEAHGLEQDSKWEFKNLSDPQEFQKAISILTVFYQEILEDT